MLQEVTEAHPLFLPNISSTLVIFVQNFPLYKNHGENIRRDIADAR